MARAKLGEILISQGVIDEATLKLAMGSQVRFAGQRLRLGQILVDLGACGTEEVAKALAVQLSVPYTELKAVEPTVGKLLPEALCKEHVAIAYQVEPGPPEAVRVAFADPTDFMALDAVRFRLGKPLKVGIATPEAIAEAQQRLFGNPDEPQGMLLEGSLLLGEETHEHFEIESEGQGTGPSLAERAQSSSTRDLLADLGIPGIPSRPETPMPTGNQPAGFDELFGSLLPPPAPPPSASVPLSDLIGLAPAPMPLQLQSPLPLTMAAPAPIPLTPLPLTPLPLTPMPLTQAAPVRGPLHGAPITVSAVGAPLPAFDLDVDPLSDVPNRQPAAIDLDDPLADVPTRKPLGAPLPGGGLIGFTDFSAPAPAAPAPAVAVSVDPAPLEDPFAGLLPVSDTRPSMPVQAEAPVALPDPFASLEVPPPPSAPAEPPPAAPMFDLDAEPAAPVEALIDLSIPAPPEVLPESMVTGSIPMDSLGPIPEQPAPEFQEPAPEPVAPWVPRTPPAVVYLFEDRRIRSPRPESAGAPMVIGLGSSEFRGMAGEPTLESARPKLDSGEFQLPPLSELSAPLADDLVAPHAESESMGQLDTRPSMDVAPAQQGFVVGGGADPYGSLFQEPEGVLSMASLPVAAAAAVGAAPLADAVFDFPSHDEIGNLPTLDIPAGVAGPAVAGEAVFELSSQESAGDDDISFREPELPLDVGGTIDLPESPVAGAEAIPDVDLDLGGGDDLGSAVTADPVVPVSTFQGVAPAPNEQIAQIVPAPEHLPLAALPTTPGPAGFQSNVDEALDAFFDGFDAPSGPPIQVPAIPAVAPSVPASGVSLEPSLPSPSGPAPEGTLEFSPSALAEAEAGPDPFASMFGSGDAVVDDVVLPPTPSVDPFDPVSPLPLYVPPDVHQDSTSSFGADVVASAEAARAREAVAPDLAAMQFLDPDPAPAIQVDPFGSLPPLDAGPAAMGADFALSLGGGDDVSRALEDAQAAAVAQQARPPSWSGAPAASPSFDFEPAADADATVRSAPGLGLSALAGAAGLVGIGVALTETVRSAPEPAPVEAPPAPPARVVDPDADLLASLETMAAGLPLHSGGIEPGRLAAAVALLLLKRGDTSLAELRALL